MRLFERRNSRSEVLKPGWLSPALAMSIAFNVRKAIKQLIWLAVLFGLAGCSANRGGHAVTLHIRGSEYDADAGASLGGIVREGGLEREA